MNVLFDQVNHIISSGAAAGSRVAGGVVTDPGNLQASRATFMKSSANFDGAAWLSAFPAACFREPRLLVDGVRDREVPRHTQNGDVEQLLAYFGQWDDACRLALEGRLASIWQVCCATRPRTRTRNGTRRDAGRESQR